MKSKLFNKKLYLLCFFIIFQSFLDSCCPDEGKECVNVTSMELSHFDSSNKEEISSLTTISKDEYAILLEANTIMGTTCNISETNFGSSLYAAIDCGEPIPTLQDTIVNVSIISNTDLNDNYITGTELKTIFEPLTMARNCLGSTSNTYGTGSFDCFRSLFWSESVNSIEDAFNDIFLSSYSWEQSKLEGSLFLLKLKMDEPITEGSHRFTISVEFASGKKLTTETEEIVIQ